MDPLTGEHLPPPRDSGDWNHFANAQDRFTGWLSRLYRERGVPTDTIDDLIQRVWTAIWQAVRAGRYDPTRAAASTYIHAVALNIWRQWVERECPRRAPGGHEADGRIMGSTPLDRPPTSQVANSLDAMEEAEAIDAVREVVYRDGRAGSSLSDEDVHILRLLAHGAGDRDLAKALGISPSTANARKRRALMSLRDILVRRGIDPEGSPKHLSTQPERRRGSTDQHSA
jgi:RNA polymerase sigma factor (sigma-70 family)